MGSARTGLPVRASSALHTAGATGGVEGSPTPELQPRGDVFEYQGHLYAAKQPGQFLAGAAAYALLRPFRLRYRDRFTLTAALVTFLTASLVTAAAAVAVFLLARSLAAYYAPHGIRVNAIAPSLIATPMSRRAQEDEAILAYLAQKQPLAGGPIDPDDVTPVALHLLSEESRMVTGQVVAVDGGWTAQ